MPWYSHAHAGKTPLHHPGRAHRQLQARAHSVKRDAQGENSFGRNCEGRHDITPRYAYNPHGQACVLRTVPGVLMEHLQVSVPPISSILCRRSRHHAAQAGSSAVVLACITLLMSAAVRSALVRFAQPRYAPSVACCPLPTEAGESIPKSVKEAKSLILRHFKSTPDR